MTKIAQDSLATIYFRLTWKSSHASHIDRYLASNVSLTRDILPVGIKSRLIGLGVGDSITMDMDMAEVPPFKPGKVLDMPRPRFIGSGEEGDSLRPRIGRYYPKNYIEAVPGTRPDSSTPFRVVAVDKAGFKADLNHPMAGREVSIKATVLDIKPSTAEAGKLHRWPEIILKGPGMQSRLPDTPTDFLGSNPFRREDESGDAEFYASPRKDSLLDPAGHESVRRAYGRLLKDGMNILDLMASHHSHMPDGLKPASVVGLGMNQEELDGNPELTERVVRNLNEDATLPFEDAQFDAVISTASVEYLTKPFEVFEETARVLKPGGIFAVSFTNRWFDPKVIEIWTQLEDFERMGLVSQFFVRAEQFKEIHTASERGWPLYKNKKERYNLDLPESDPVYTVWGIK